MVLDATLLNTQQYMVRIKGKEEQYMVRIKGKLAPSPTLQCSSQWKGGLRVTVDYGG